MAGMSAHPSMGQSSIGEPESDLQRADSLPVANAIESRDSGHFAFDDYLHSGVLDAGVDADDMALLGTRALGERRSSRTAQLCILNACKRLSRRA